MMEDKRFKAINSKPHEALALIKELVEAVHYAYNEGFVEGIKDYTTSKGGKTWAESNSAKSLAKAKTFVKENG
jgi:hypothetical protein